MGPLVAVGCAHVTGRPVRDLKLRSTRSEQDGSPDIDELKWSPDKEFPGVGRPEVRSSRRVQLAALGIAKEAGAAGIVVMENVTKRQGRRHGPVARHLSSLRARTSHSSWANSRGVD
jgi:hypothetical protein